MIGRIQRVPLREVWKHEAHDFTRWLVDNIDVLNAVPDLGLRNAEREQAAGSFSVDLIAEDGAGNTVAIENQPTCSEHGSGSKWPTVWYALKPRSGRTEGVLPVDRLAVSSHRSHRNAAELPPTAAVPSAATAQLSPK